MCFCPLNSWHLWVVLHLVHTWWLFYAPSCRETAMSGFDIRAQLINKKFNQMVWFRPLPHLEYSVKIKKNKWKSNLNRIRREFRKNTSKNKKKIKIRPKIQFESNKIDSNNSKWNLTCENVKWANRSSRKINLHCSIDVDLSTYFSVFIACCCICP